MCEHLCLKETQEDFFRRLKTINFESLHITITMSYCKAKTMEWNCMSLRNVMFVCEKTSVDISLQWWRVTSSAEVCLLHLSFSPVQGTA